MTITLEELQMIDNLYQENYPGSVKMAEYRIQRILGLLDVGDIIEIEGLDIKIKTIDEFKTIVKSKYSFSHLITDDLLRDWRKS